MLAYLSRKGHPRHTQEAPPKKLMKKQIPLIEVAGVLLSTDILTERFCCDLDSCGGACCIEGDAGAPVTLDEIGEIEDAIDAVWPEMSASAQAVVDAQGVAYTDPEGELVTSIVNGKDCVFTCYDQGCCLCLLEKAQRAGKTKFVKPISCALYPIREKRLGADLVGLNYHRWAVCEGAVRRGRELDLPLYRFLRGPLTRRFGKAWFDELEQVVAELKAQGMIE